MLEQHFVWEKGAMSNVLQQNKYTAGGPWSEWGTLNQWGAVADSCVDLSF